MPTNSSGTRQTSERLVHSHPDGRLRLGGELEEAGPTVFDWLVEIFEERIPGRLSLR